jgi:LAO/AO transport system kinase
MPGLEGLEGAFVRSMATRGNLGGLAAATSDVVTLLDASGRDPIFIETVGVGQDEVDIVGVADLSIVVLVPGMGDDVQALKAGIMEIGDIFVINKSDHPGADKIERTLEDMLALSPNHGSSRSIIRTVATEGSGVGDLVAAIDRASGKPGREAGPNARQRRAAENRLRALLAERLVAGIFRSVVSADAFEASIEAVALRKTDPYTVVDDILQHVRFGEQS